MKPHLLSGALAALASLTGAQKVPLTSIKTLTLRSGQMTTSRRVAPMPQLTCIGGSARGLYEIDVMRCTNLGSDYGAADTSSASWSCTAELPPHFKLGSTDVVCEGYASAEDPNVLRGSCGVEYRLALTDLGFQKYGDRRGGVFSGWGGGGEGGAGGAGGEWWPKVFMLLFWSVVAVIVYGAWTARNTPGAGPGGAGGGGGGRPWFGGGGGGDGGDDPPPYDPPPYYPKPSTRGAGLGAGAGAGGWNPGFLGGLAAGAAGTYLMNRNRGEGGRERTARTWGGGGGSGVGGSGWGGSGGSGSGGSMWGGGGGESSSAGAARHESTGFGQTRRR
ncbi:hypothetical protein EDC01DRAFT_619683 [Geopyxis carbonaria]|nr:hypothetical protein EDC01DRAFT_619683 [Geopyxis carbonaria]